MAITYKVLGQAAPAANVLTTVYTVPSGNSAVISTIMVCNQSSGNLTYRLAVQPGNAAITSAHYIAYDATITAKDSIGLTLGITLAATDVISANCSGANISINVFGSEMY
jgi:hypothetical protein